MSSAARNEARALAHRDAVASAPTDAILVLVGVTAGRHDREFLTGYFRDNTGCDVFVPAVPQSLGLRASSRWLLRYLRRTLAPHDYDRVHVLNYISGGLLFRAIAPKCDFLRFGRVVYERGPIQELLPARLVRRFTRTGTLLLRGRTLVDLAQGLFQDLPFPSTGMPQGLIVETRPSAIARSMELGHWSVPAEDWETDRMLPLADAAISLPLSHDDVYRSELFLDQARHFLIHGSFLPLPEDHMPPLVGVTT